MKAMKLLKSGTVIIGLFLGAAQLSAETITYYFTGSVDNSYKNLTNWTTNSDGTGDSPASTAVLYSSNQIIPSGKAVTYSGSNVIFYGTLVIESGSEFVLTSGQFNLFESAKVTVKSGATFNPRRSTLYGTSSIEIEGTLTATFSGISSSSGEASSVEVKQGGQIILTGSTNIISSVNKIINNGTISAGKITNIGSIEGIGTITTNAGEISITGDPAASTFLQTGGGTVIYNNSAGTLTPIYNNVEIKNAAAARTLTGKSVVHGNLALTDNAAQITLSDTVTIEGNLTVADSKVVTNGALKLAGSIAISNLAEGSVLNLILNGTEQNIEGVFNNLEIAEGTTVNLTNDLTVTNLLNNGTINKNGHTLTVLNELAALVAELQGIVDGVSANYTEAHYTPASWAALQEVITGVQPLLDEGVTSTTVELEAAIRTVNASIAALVSQKSILVSWLNGIKTSYPAISYTVESYAPLQTAIDAVETFLTDNTNITANDVQ